MLNHLLIMGSAEGTQEKRNVPMADTNRTSIKSILKKPFQALFQKEKKKEKKQIAEKTTTKPVEVTPVAVLLDNLQKLEIKDENELENFTFNVVKEESDKVAVRADSHSSEDSGFSEKCATEDDKHDDKELIESMNDLKVNDGDEKKKKKKIQTVYITRKPVKSKVVEYRTSAHPYISASQDTADNTYREINQVNKQTLSGGHVLTKCTPADYQLDINYVLQQIDQNVQDFARNSEHDREVSLAVALEYVNCETNNPLQGFPEDEISQEYNVISPYQPARTEPNPVEEFSIANHAAYEEFQDLELASISDYVEENSIRIEKSMYPTPPRSESMTSPVYPYSTLSSELSPLGDSDNEKYQELYDVSKEYPSCITNVDVDKTKKERSSTSSMTMKQYKDLQKEITTGFSKKECCLMNRKTCKQIFSEHMEKIKVEDLKDLCVKVAKLDLETAYGVLHHILLSLSSSGKEEDLQLALFNLICERVMAQKSLLFVGDFGLSLIKSAALRCYRRPILTRYLVQCIRNALKYNSPPQETEYLFHEVDALGDNLLVACVRAGDVCADVLSELVRKEAGQLPLFDVHHTNTDGYTALHIACSLHSAETPKLQTVHVLLHHGDADVWRGDVKGGDTAVHLAINSPTCDLRLVMIIFRHIDRKMWKKLAHAPNRSSVTPLEYARLAIKSTTRQNYPHEVLEFLKKCR